MAVTQDQNVGSAFLASAKAHPERIAIRDEDAQIAYGTLAHLAFAFAQRLKAMGVRRGAALGVRTDDLSVLLSTIFASALLGARWAYADRNLLSQGKLALDLVLETEPFEGGRIPGAVTVGPGWEHAPESSEALPGYGDAEDIWIISQTSGTIGTPKLVGLSPRTVSARIAANRDLFPSPGMGVTGLFPIHAPALIGRYLAALNHGATIVASIDPRFWNEAGVGLVFGSPVQLGKAMEGIVLPRKLAAVHVSGGPLTDTLARHLLASFERVASGYGSTETNNLLSNIKSLSPDGRIVTRTELRPGVEIEIVNEAGEPLPAGTEGIVRIRNPYLAPGYLDAPEAQAAAFRDGWFYPGDLGLWTLGCEFVPTGRINDQFNLGGVKVNAQLLDFALQSVAGVRDAISFLMPREDGSGRLTAFLSIDPAADPTEVIAEAKVAAIRFCGRDAVPEKFLFANTLPRNPNGKPNRKACIALVKEARALRKAAIG